MLRILICLFAFISVSASAGKVTVEKNESVIRNDLFNPKRERAMEYKRLEAQRQSANEAWSYRLTPECVLLRDYNLIYICAGSKDLKHAHLF